MRRRDEKFPENGFEAWGGYMQAKIAKLEEQFCVSAGKEEALSDIFNGVSIYVNGFTVPSADELKVLMSKHGGTYHTYQRSDDFIIASNLPDTKVKNMNLSKVVKPEWITDSLKSNRLLDFREYLLYKNSRTQRQLNFHKVIKSNDSIPATSKLEDGHNDYDSKGEYETFEENSKATLKNETCIQETLPAISVMDVKKSSDINIQATSKAISGPVTKTAADPNFIAEFYNNSRLHHISQLGACFKQHINDLRENSNFQFPARVELKDKIINSNNFNNFTQLKFEKNKVIMHIDMDCFFVSVGLRNKPELRGKPVAVTHSKGGQGRPKRAGVDRHAEFSLYKQKQIKKFSVSTGHPENEVVIETRVDSIGDENEKYGSMSEIASCSYEAREKGIGNGMFMGAALKLCPDLLTIPYDFDGYKEVAYTLYNTIAQYTLDVEAVSCDEMYVDCTELLADMNVNVQSFATMLREEIKSKTGCPCSTGFGGNRLQARLATKRAKPDGQFFLTEDLIEDFIHEIKLRDLPGVGRQTAQKLEALGHVTCGSLQSLSLASLKSQLGNKTGAQLFDQCRGRDQHPLTFLTVRKSVSAEVNYGIRFENSNQCTDFLKQLSAEVHTRMQQFKVVGKCITLKLMVRDEEAPVETAKFLGHGYCNIINKSTSLNKATNDVEVITKEVLSLCKKQNIDPKEMRGIGIQVTKLEPVNAKPSKGAINKFLSSNIKTTIKCESNSSEGVSTTGGKMIIKKTPTKLKKIISPKKKSPIISTKSPLGKRRGRPPKSLKLLQSSNRSLAPSKSGPSISKNLPSTSKKVMNKFLQGQNASKDLPYKNPMIKEILPKEEPPVGKEPKGLIGLSWKTVRDMLRAWLNSDQTPLQCDVNMIVEYLQEMVLTKDLEHLFVLMNFLRRVTKEVGSDEWLKVYDSIHEQVQNVMIAVYGKKLYVFDD
ncbi:DNA repair protein REV1 [Trichoplusia ni]|uniref:DNA repair protein REV1 n=1 Tax=Trichoplusia ni TaxID=7111 RepID=A0A7E5VQY9_TRINI|nr:DNA repair protein REV1 [Trichoplusia ni]